MANSIAYRKNYTDVLDRVYQRAACSTVLNSPRRVARAGRNAKEIMIPKISVTGLGDYTRNVGYKTGSITFDYETKAFAYDRGIRLLADVMDTDNAVASLRRHPSWTASWRPRPARFYTTIDLLSGDSDQFGYAKASDGRDIDSIVVRRATMIEPGNHVATSAWPLARPAQTWGLSWRRFAAALIAPQGGLRMVLDAVRCLPRQLP